MIDNKLPLDKHQENTDLSATAQTYTRSTGTNIGNVPRDENAPTISHQPDARPTGTSTGNVPRDENAPTISRQPDTRPASKGISPALARLLTGGLIGLTLGTLAGAFANKKTAKAVNHAAKGVGEGAKTVAEGVNHSAKGVGDVVKSVAEGVNYAVIGAVESLKDSAEDVEQSTVIEVDAVKDTTEDAKQFTVDAVKDTAENTKQFAVGTLDAVKDTAENTKQSTVGAADAVKDTAENTKQFAVGAADAVKDTAENVKSSDAQSSKLYEPLTTGKNQVTTGEVNLQEDVETQLADLLVLTGPEELVDQSIPVDVETPVVLGEAGFFEEDVERREY